MRDYAWFVLLNNSLSFGSVTERLHGFNALNENNAEKPGANRAKGKNCGVYFKSWFCFVDTRQCFVDDHYKKV